MGSSQRHILFPNLSLLGKLSHATLAIPQAGLPAQVDVRLSRKQRMQRIMRRG